MGRPWRQTGETPRTFPTEPILNIDKFKFQYAEGCGAKIAYYFALASVLPVRTFGAPGSGGHLSNAMSRSVGDTDPRSAKPPVVRGDVDSRTIFGDADTGLHHR